MRPRLPVAFAALLLLGPTTTLSQAVPSSRRGVPLSEPLSEVHSIEELADGRVVISDYRERTLYLGDFRTGTLVPLGRQGAGPNEYSSVGPLARVAGDTILSVDFSARRALRLSLPVG